MEPLGQNGAEAAADPVGTGAPAGELVLVPAEMLPQLDGLDASLLEHAASTKAPFILVPASCLPARKVLDAASLQPAAPAAAQGPSPAPVPASPAATTPLAAVNIQQSPYNKLPSDSVFEAAYVAPAIAPGAAGSNPEQQQQQQQQQAQDSNNALYEGIDGQDQLNPSSEGSLEPVACGGAAAQQPHQHQQHQATTPPAGLSAGPGAQPPAAAVVAAGIATADLIAAQLAASAVAGPAAVAAEGGPVEGTASAGGSTDSNAPQAGGSIGSNGQQQPCPAAAGGRAGSSGAQGTGSGAGAFPAPAAAAAAPPRFAATPRLHLALNLQLPINNEQRMAAAEKAAATFGSAASLGAIPTPVVPAASSKQKGVLDPMYGDVRPEDHPLTALLLSDVNGRKSAKAAIKSVLTVVSDLAGKMKLMVEFVDVQSHTQGFCCEAIAKQPANAAAAGGAVGPSKGDTAGGKQEDPAAEAAAEGGDGSDKEEELVEVARAQGIAANKRDAKRQAAASLMELLLGGPLRGSIKAAVVPKPKAAATQQEAAAADASGEGGARTHPPEQLARARGGLGVQELQLYLVGYRQDDYPKVAAHFTRLEALGATPEASNLSPMGVLRQYLTATHTSLEEEDRSLDVAGPYRTILKIMRNGSELLRATGVGRSKKEAKQTGAAALLEAAFKTLADFSRHAVSVETAAQRRKFGTAAAAPKGDAGLAGAGRGVRGGRSGGRGVGRGGGRSAGQGASAGYGAPSGPMRGPSPAAGGGMKRVGQGVDYSYPGGDREVKRYRREGPGGWRGYEDAAPVRAPMQHREWYGPGGGGWRGEEREYGRSAPAWLPPQGAGPPGHYHHHHQPPPGPAPGSGGGEGRGGWAGYGAAGGGSGGSGGNAVQPYPHQQQHAEAPQAPYQQPITVVLPQHYNHHHQQQVSPAAAPQAVGVPGLQMVDYTSSYTAPGAAAAGGGGSMVIYAAPLGGAAAAAGVDAHQQHLQQHAAQYTTQQQQPQQQQYQYQQPQPQQPVYQHAQQAGYNSSSSSWGADAGAAAAAPAAGAGGVMGYGATAHAAPGTAAAAAAAALLQQQQQQLLPGVGTGYGSQGGYSGMAGSGGYRAL